MVVQTVLLMICVNRICYSPLLCTIQCKSAGLFVAGLLYVRGRGLIIKHLHRHYFRGINYYRLNIADHTIDNP